jgi:predicted XRE-type DNA-binding protein
MRWKKIKNFNYKVSSDGKVKSILSNKVLKPYSAGRGYLAVGLYKNKKCYKFYVHRLVAEAFLRPKNKTVNHIDGVKTNNVLDNLEWCSYSENHSHAFKLGLKIPREINSELNINNKLTKVQAKKIYNLSKQSNLTQREIADMFNIDRTVVGKIKNKKLWKSIHKGEQ